MLSKQSIRGKVKIFVDEKLSTKDEIISLSKSWSEKDETLFRKMLKQGGKFKIKGKRFHINPPDALVTSKGEIAVIQTPMDHSGDDVDLNYLK